jgi:hypothetical protein
MPIAGLKAFKWNCVLANEIIANKIIIQDQETDKDLKNWEIRQKFGIPQTNSGMEMVNWKLSSNVGLKLSFRTVFVLSSAQSAGTPKTSSTTNGSKPVSPLAVDARGLGNCWADKIFRCKICGWPGCLRPPSSPPSFPASIISPASHISNGFSTYPHPPLAKNLPFKLIVEFFKIIYRIKTQTYVSQNQTLNQAFYLIIIEH